MTVFVGSVAVLEIGVGEVLGPGVAAELVAGKVIWQAVEAALAGTANIH
jgi:hypothetical protein